MVDEIEKGHHINQRISVVGAYVFLDLLKKKRPTLP